MSVRPLAQTVAGLQWCYACQCHNEWVPALNVQFHTKIKTLQYIHTQMWFDPEMEKKKKVWFICIGYSDKMKLLEEKSFSLKFIPSLIFFFFLNFLSLGQNKSNTWETGYHASLIWLNFYTEEGK